MNSYDFDAPLSENGAPTPKFAAIRKVLAEFGNGIDPDSPLPEALPVRAYGDVNLTEYATLSDNLNVLAVPIRSPWPPSMEEAVNAIAPIRAEKNGKAWRQTIWYPFALTARHARGTVLRQQLESDRFTASDGDRELAAYYGVTIWNREKHEIVLIGLNRLMTEPLALEFRAEGMRLESVEGFQTMFHPDLEAVNSQEAESVSPTAGVGTVIAQGRLTVELPPASWNLIRLKITVE